MHKHLFGLLAIPILYKEKSIVSKAAIRLDLNYLITYLTLVNKQIFLGIFRKFASFKSIEVEI